MTRPFYTSFSWAYDLLINEPVAGRLQFIIEMLAQSGIRPSAHALDAGCGTGRYSVALAKAGFSVNGIDASPDQVAEAKKRQDRSGKTDIHFIVGDICKLRHDPTFDAILCRGVLNDLTDDTSRQAFSHPSLRRFALAAYSYSMCANGLPPKSERQLIPCSKRKSIPKEDA
jgi:ubiquinone/menaquinone biosynthesis C-methylase UbiE